MLNNFQKLFILFGLINFTLIRCNNLILDNNNEIAAQVDQISQFTNVKRNCGGTSKSVKTIIKSPNYPKPYDSNLFCEYIIKSPFVCHNEFQIEFIEFFVETSNNCINDKLIIANNDNLCGNIIGIKKYQSTDGILKLQFMSNQAKEEKGFYIIVTRLPCTDDNFSTTTTELDIWTIDNTFEMDINHEESTTDIIILNNLPSPTNLSLDLLPPKTNTASSFATNFKDKQEESEFIAKPNGRYLPSFNQNGYLPPQDEYQPPKNNPYPPLYPQNCYPNSKYPYPQYPQFPQHPQYPTNPYPIIPPNYPTNSPIPIVPPIFQFPVQPGLNFPTPNIQPQQQLPPLQPNQCCATPYQQRRFYLISPGFPSNNIQRRDCFYYINKSNPNICRLRIIFKFFLIGDIDNSLGCNDFLEIDGQRLCGCRTGLTFIAQWGLGSKVIRIRTGGGYVNRISGFVLDIIQEDCPYRMSGLPDIQAAESRISNNNYPNNILSIVNNSNRLSNFSKMPKSSSSLTTYYYYEDQIPNQELDIADKELDQRAEGTSSNFYLPTGGGNQNVCQFGYIQWAQLSLDSLFINKPICYPPRY